MTKNKTLLGIFLVLLTLILSGCASPEKVTEEPLPEKKVTKPRREPPIDINKLQSKLNMHRDRSDLGFKEKSFDACKLGLTDSYCRTRYFSSLHLRVMCRDSVGTVEHVSHMELKPMVSRNLEWRLGLKRGRLHFDSQGYGQIRAITPGSSKSQRMILIKGKKSLGLTAEDASRIVVPKDWCI